MRASLTAKFPSRVFRIRVVVRLVTRNSGLFPQNPVAAPIHADAVS